MLFNISFFFFVLQKYHMIITLDIFYINYIYNKFKATPYTKVDMYFLDNTCNILASDSSY